MKDHVEVGHLTKYDALRMNRDQVVDLEIYGNGFCRHFHFHANQRHFVRIVSHYETGKGKHFFVIKISKFA